MSTATASGGEGPVYYDPYRRDIVKNPYPTYRRLREEAPLYYNEEYDFYAVSRYEDVRNGLADNKTFISGRGGILEIIKADVEMPPGTFIFEDPPLHTMHRTVVQRIFSPRRMNGLEERVRAITVNCLDKLAGRREFDFISDIGTQVPMRVIGTLLGIPEEDFDAVRESADARLRTEEGQQMDYSGGFHMDESFEPYLEWRSKNPADDVITELLQVEFEDETGTRRRLSREELITFCTVLAGAGNETTNKLIGWTGKTLAEHPDQRRALVEDPSLIPDAVEEILRYEPPGPHIGRYVARDTEFHGRTVPAGSAILFIAASANRDHRVFPDPDRFDIHRDRAAHCTFGYGIHTCIGNVLARLEGRVVLQELLKRFPEWNVDMDRAELESTTTVRGWATLPAYVGSVKPRPVAKPAPEDAAAPPASVDGTWTVTIKGPTGAMPSTLVLETVDGVLTGNQSGEGTTTPIDGITYEQGKIVWTNAITKPMKLKLQFSGEVRGDTMEGKDKAGFMGSYPFTGTRTA